MALYAGGSKDQNSVEMSSLESWQEELDISNKRRGKYNILITATDIAGNEGTVGPFNMYIDPDSDLPIVHISNPVNEGRVVGNINIVGTCVDDDDVGYVELRIDGGDEVYRAKGKEFWSYFLNTSGFEEGNHTIEAWGVDINGVKGKTVKTTFCLDNNRPQTTVNNKSVGEIVSGKIDISGVVVDGNGIDRLLYSLDEGNKFEEVKLYHNKKTKNASFDLRIDTREIPDGPKVCWFKAYDKQGSVGIYTFLFFVDNTPPQVEFIYPNDETEVFGSVFSVAGKTVDTVGIESLTWICGKESGEFEITPGNPYWIKEFDLTNVSGSSARVDIIAKDIAGNIVTASKTVLIDKKKDVPSIEMLSPLPSAQIESDLYISGIVHDSYGASELKYRIDKGEEKTLSLGFGGFGVLESGLPAGNHVLTINAINNRGVAGRPLFIEFTAGGLPPSISFENNETVIPAYHSKSRIYPYAYVRASAGLKYVSVGFNNEEETPIAIKPGQTEYIVKPPVSSAPLGMYTISITAVDLQDRTTRQNLVIRVVDPSGATGAESFSWASGNTSDSGQIFMLDGQPLVGVYEPKEGAAIESVEVLGASGFNASFEGNIVRLSAQKDGLFKGLSVKITDTNGESFKTSPIDVFSDTSVPEISLNMPEEPSFIKNSIVLKGTAVDGAGIKSVEYALGPDFNYLPLKSSFNEVINLSSREDGPLLLAVRATDKVGRTHTEYRVFYKDNEAPLVTMVVPTEGDKVNGSIASAFKVIEKFPNVKAEYKGANKDAEWQEFPYSTLPNVIIGTAKEPINKKMQFRFTDMAGNVRIFNNYNFEIDNDADIPVVDLHLPTENEVIFSNFEISGMIYDDDAPAKLYYKIDDEAYKEIEVKNNFSIPIDFTTLTDNEHTITVYGEDIYGVKSAPVTRKIRVSRQVPIIAVETPNISETVKGTVVISGTATDKNGIDYVEVSMDNGNTFSRAEGTDKWKYVVNTHVIDDGTHVLFVRATDKYGQQALFSTLINIDNTPPVLKFEYPLQGSKLDKNLFVSGKTQDNISLEGLSLSIKSLDGKTVPPNLANMKLKTEILVSKDIDISRLQEGRYNLEISGIDKAQNTTEVSVNFEVYRQKDKNKIELLYPLNGETVRGEFNIYGRVISDSKMEQATLYIDDKEVETVPVSKTDYVAFKISSDIIGSGKHKLEIRGTLNGNNLIVSNAHRINYEKVGPWVTIDNFAMGDFAIERPYLRGRAGYTVSEEEEENVYSKTATAEEKRAFKAKRLEKVEISFDNGKTFIPVKVKKGWKYRIETGDMAEGNHFLLVRATMENREVATCRSIIKINKTKPNITLISPGEGGRYNNAIEFAGLAYDDIELSSVKATLRKGDKSSYGVPKFIQGLHFEMAFWGASLWNIGMGLSFFDNNVKLQIHYGQFTQKQFNTIYGNKRLRYGGHICSLKILANVVEIPFGYYCGPDWNWLYMSMALGAQFSLFTVTQSGKPQVLAAMLAQLEFPRVKFHKQKYFSSFAFFTEGQLWFVPTDVQSGEKKGKKSVIKSLIPHISCGIRVDVF